MRRQRQLLIAVGVCAATAIASVLLAVAASPLQPGSPGADPGEPGTPTPAPATALGATDVAYLQLMIPMNESVLRLLEIAADPTYDGIATNHRAELTRMRAVLAAAAVPEGNLHDGHELPGLFSDAQLAAVAALDPAARPGRVRAMLREHLTQSERVSTGETRSGTDPGTVAIATTMIETRKAQLAQLSGE